MKRLTNEEIFGLREDVREALIQQDVEDNVFINQIEEAADRATTLDEFADIFCDLSYDAPSFLFCVAAALDPTMDLNFDKGFLNHPFTNLLRTEYNLSYDLTQFST